jgi:TolB protein
MNKTIIKIVFIILFFNAKSDAHAVLSIDIDNGNVQPINVSVLGLESTPAIQSVISNDLNNSGLFKVNHSYHEGVNINNPINFDVWSKKDINFVVICEALQTNDTIQVKYRVWNTFAKKHVVGKVVDLDPKKWRQLSHIIADQVYEASTGDEGYFNTRILYVAEYGPFNNRIKRIAIMDYDGENNEYITSDKYTILTPRISSDNKKIMYMSYANKTPKVYLYDRESTRHSVVGNFDGMTSAPRFGFNANLALLALSKNGATNIYKFDIDSMAKKALTDNNYINTSPSYSPDNQFIVFNSDRSGSPQLYVMRNDGSDQKRISFGLGKYLNPVWSPKGDYIAFIKLLNGTFYIGIMRPNGSEEKILASGYLIESPSWAPNGRILVFTSTNRPVGESIRKSKLYMVDITGKYHKAIKTPTDATDPMWSPRVGFQD